MKYFGLIYHIVVQTVLVVMWGMGVIDRTLPMLIVATSYTWAPYLSIFVLKGVEKVVRRRIGNKIKKSL